MRRGELRDLFHTVKPDTGTREELIEVVVRWWVEAFRGVLDRAQRRDRSLTPNEDEVRRFEDALRAYLAEHVPTDGDRLVLDWDYDPQTALAEVFARADVQPPYVGQVKASMSVTRDYVEAKGGYGQPYAVLFPPGLADRDAQARTLRDDYPEAYWRVHGLLEAADVLHGNAEAIRARVAQHDPLLPLLLAALEGNEEALRKRAQLVALDPLAAGLLR